MDPNTLGVVVSVSAGVITVLATIVVIVGTANIRLPRRSRVESSPYAPVDMPIDEDAVRWSIWWAHRGMVVFYLVMGLVLVCGPKYLFGPTWYYFQGIPHGGKGMGSVCLGLAVAMVFAIWRKSKKLVSLVLFGGGISFWIAAFLIAAQGLSARTGCIEALFMMYAAIDMLIRAAVIRR